MYSTLSSQQQLEHQRLVSQMQNEIFTYLQVEYKVNDIPLIQNESIHTVFIPTNSDDSQQCENYFVSHGFGGSALMNFKYVETLRKKGNVIFWEIRGMGFSSKLNEYNVEDIYLIEQFFLKTIETLLIFYNYPNSSFIGHSFSAYLLLLFSIRCPQLTKSHIKKMILLSSIGITIKQQDYKNQINGCSDIFHTLFNKFGWAFNLTYKSPLRTICRCLKSRLIKSGLKDFGDTQKQRQLMCKIIQTLILLPDGSECLFFKLFQPRVIPKIALQPLLVDEPEIDIVLVFGGQEDWVDKRGGKKVSERFAKKISFINFNECGHNIPFNSTVCKQIFADNL